MREQLVIPFPATLQEKEDHFDPLQATFSGGAKDPFCRWFPYLEGYSPKFVETILRLYAPNARRILDPFGGTATTAFEAASRGLSAYICEVNPVMQFIFEVKSEVRLLGSKARKELARQIGSLAEQFDSQQQDYPLHAGLNADYHAAFGNSIFFEDDNYQQVLRTRSLIESLREQNPLLARVLMVAVFGSLLPASRLKRAGDVRYMTEREVAKKGIPRFSEVVVAKLFEIKSDIRNPRLDLKSRPLLICSDAKRIRDLPSLQVDTVITSPPYVNGTNYFRNTKLELWFLGCLSSKDDLGAFRKLAITAGINDVTVKGSQPAHHPKVERVVEQLKENAYDQRIPRMVASYFAEMTEVFEGLRHHLTDGATVAVDIGDSNYGGVHVPADQLFIECFGDLGYDLRDEVLLRERRSKNGAPLSQVLLVFSYRKQLSLNGQRYRSDPSWTASWNTFKEDLPFQKEPFSKRNWGSNLHSLCSYAGKLKPAIAYHLVNTFVPEGGVMLDPFAGVGTIPFEAALNGRKAYGLDLNEAATTIARAKLQITEATQVFKIIQRLEDFIASYNPIDSEWQETETFGFNGKLVEYYHRETLKEILAARHFFAEQDVEDPSVALALAATLHILHGNRPYALSRRSHPITPYAPTGEFEYRPLIPRLREKIERSLSEDVGEAFVPGRIYEQDATSWWPLEIDQLDAVITSPPFFDSTRFHVQNWLRLWFMGWKREDFDQKPQRFVDERQKDSFTVYESIIRQSKERLKPGGVVVFHLGKSKKCDMAQEIAELGKRWFHHADLFDESVAHCESHGMRDKGTVTSHQYLILY